MAGTRTTIAEQLAATKTGTDVDPAKRTVQSSQSPQATASRQSDEKTNSLPSLPAVSVFVAPRAADPAERLSYCENAILHADRQTELATERITQQYLLWVGEPYQIVRDEELFRLAGYDTFDAWGRALNGHSGDYMNKVIRIGPVVRALASVTRRQLKEQPLRPLVSVQRDHGDDAARECWKTAETAGDLTERGLRDAAIKCGYKVNLEPAAGRTAPAPRPLDPAGVLNVGKLKRLAATEPARALALCRTLREEIDRLEHELTQEQPDPARPAPPTA
ncbi:hypothetical protein [Streptomyces sp. NPDC048473]|uniref:hypothetical protein n=1 Tax=Streptomyces sp. NPDC048473 TaxID=3365556 RepID=UPI00371F2C01